MPFNSKIPRRTPALDKAVLFLDRRICAAVRAGQKRLPGIAELSAEAGVSVVTLSHALHILKPRFGLTIKTKQGILLEPPGPAPHTNPAQPRWHYMVHALVKDIAEGAFSESNAFLTIRECCDRYGVGYRTSHRALDNLVEKKILFRSRRGYRLQNVALRRQASGSIVLITLGDAFGNISIDTERQQDKIRFLRDICTRSGLNLVILTLVKIRGIVQPPDSLYRYCADTDRMGFTLGFLVWTLNIPSTYLTDILQRLAESGRPVSVLDETGEITVPLPVGKRLPVRYFAMSYSEQCGKMAARFLACRGHSNAVYLSHQSDTVWSRNRERGLRDELDRLTLECSLCTLRVDLTQDIPTNDKALQSLLVKPFESVIFGEKCTRFFFT